MINYQKLIPYKEMVNISSNSIFRENWFIGSALMSVDYKNLPTGSYYYFQETVWSKILNLRNINPYWEIHNRTFNVLLVNSSIKESLNFFYDFLNNLKSEILCKGKDLVFLSSNDNFLEIAKQFECSTMSIKLPFYIEDHEVGTYSKLFVSQGTKYYPLVDFTHFDEKNSYFEISINKTYIELFYHLNKKVSNLPRQSRGIKYEFQNQDQMRFYSLLECVYFLNDNNCLLSNAYNGHTTKKILKEFYIYGKITNLLPAINSLGLSKEFKIFLEREEHKFETIYPKLIKKHTKDKLLDTYGVTNIMYEFFQGSYRTKNYEPAKDTIHYFTDIPFLDNGISWEEFQEIIVSITERKK